MDDKFFSTKMNIIDVEIAKDLLRNHRELHHMSSVVRYLVCSRKTFAGSGEPILDVDIFQIKLSDLPQILPEVFRVMANGGEYFLLAITSHNPITIAEEPFWNTFEEELFRKDSALVIAKTTFKIVLWLLRQKLYEKGSNQQNKY